jgi:CRISPR-associated protein Cmr6
MNRAAVPSEISRHGYKACPPGHRFNLWFDGWSVTRDGEWTIADGDKANGLRRLLSLGDAEPVLAKLRARQQALAEALPEDRRLVVDARSSSPFATGLGLEHPIENGFAFLSPYGLPYLAASGVKGVLRRAAEELAALPLPQAEGRGEGSQPITPEVVQALFGPEGQEAPRRGSLTLWDVFPVPAKNQLVVEIMTPHHGEYYQGKSTPHDAGKPSPVPFLAVPAGSAFRFVVTFEPALWPKDLPPPTDWKALLGRIFERAFDWLGFGAKTAVGYGAMEKLRDEEIAAAKAAARQAALRCDWVDTTLRELAAKNRASESDTLRGRALAEAWSALPDPGLKARALADIRARWQREGWWDSPPGGAAKKARTIYDPGP